MKIAITHGEVGAAASRDEQDVLTQVAFVSEGLAALGHEPLSVPVSLNLAAASQRLTELRPAMVFNLVETIIGKGNLIHLVPALLDAMKIPYTGAGTDAMFLTS
ncbi:MAG: D-alanine--D-alanine ligase, partial [Deltaproteobacteria bacterium]